MGQGGGALPQRMKGVWCSQRPVIAGRGAMRRASQLANKGMAVKAKYIFWYTLATLQLTTTWYEL